MTFEPKISGTSVKGFNIIPIFKNQLVLLSEAQKVINRQETMDFLLDTFRFKKCGDEKKYPHEWVAILDYDTIYKLSVMENYPEYEEEFIDYFGEKWIKHYIRFNH